MKSPPTRRGGLEGPPRQQPAAAKRGSTSGYLSPADRAAALSEIECRAVAIRQNAEAALMDELPVDAVLLSICALAGWVDTWSRTLR